MQKKSLLMHDNGHGCFVCDRIDLIKDGKNEYFVAELSTGYVVLGDFQYYKGYTLFLSKVHVGELHELDEAVKMKFLSEMAVVSEAVYRVFRPDKLNYELLGNLHSHLHWHIFPGYSSDSKMNRPVWEVDAAVRTSEKYRITSRQLAEFGRALGGELARLLSKK